MIERRDSPPDRRSTADHRWPTLPTDDWIDTLETLHLWTQIVGKIRMVQSPWLNHSWSVPLYVSPTGLRTSLVPYLHARGGGEAFEWTFDFLAHQLVLTTSTGATRILPLSSRPVATVHREVLDAMAEVGMPVSIHPMPSEIADAIPFPDDTVHATYVPEHARVLWRALLHAERVMTRFRAGFLGKASPVHFFWGSFDLAVTRFSGRTAPPHPGGMPNFPNDVAREAYSHEVTSCGFWPGNRASNTPIFYAYAYPVPEGFAQASVSPADAFWLDALGEFALPYSSVAAAPNPDEDLLAFFESTHAAAADLLKWPRAELECADPRGPNWWASRADRSRRAP
jgi:hypothetical protein